jgi:hypothetical protein
VAILANRNVTQKEAEEKIKYKILYIQMQKMWKMECKITPKITGVTVSNKSFKEKFGTCTRKTYKQL